MYHLMLVSCSRYPGLSLLVFPFLTSLLASLNRCTLCPIYAAYLAGNEREECHSVMGTMPS